MNQFFYRLAAAHTVVALMLLAGCGGGTPEVVGTPLVKAVLLAAPQDRCDKGQYNTDTVSFVSIDGACTKMFAPMTTPLSVAGSPPVEASATISASETPTASPQAVVDDPSPIPSRRLLAAHARFTWPSLLSWAAANYPQFFRGSYQDGVLGEYTYRYWPSTGHYIGLRNSEQLYVLGPATDDEILYIGTLGALICVVYPDNCNAGSDSSSNAVDIAGSASTTAVLVTTTPYSSTIEIESDKDWFAVDMVAGSTYTFNLEGSLNGKGTLADPYLELFSSSSQSLETNDDISYPDNLNSRLTYTPTASGRYFVSASGYSSLGTYQLSVSVTGGTSTGSTGSYFAERPSVSWVERQYPVTSPPLFVFDLNICGPDCLPVVALTMPNPSYTGILSNVQRAGTRRTWNGGNEVTHTVKDQVSRELNAMLTSLWSQPAQPDKVTLRAAINSGFSSATTPGGVTAGAAVSLAAKGFPTGYTASGTGGSGLAGTWCTDVNGNQNCWVFDNNTGSTTGAFYQQSINQYSGTLTNTMTWSVQGGSMTYRFTRSTLTNSAQNYDNPLTQPAYTFQYTVVGNSFTFQNIVFIRK